MPQQPRPWRTTILALLAFVLVPLLPTALQVVLPITQTIVLLVALLAVCGLLGWWKGGHLVVAVVWVALAGWMVSSPLTGVSGGAYGTLFRGWVLLLAAAFGVASLLVPKHPFATRALSALGIAVVAAFALVVLTPGGVTSVRETMVAEYSARADAIIAGVENRVRSPEWRQMAERVPALNDMIAESEVQLRSLPAPAAALVPALLALESLAALALAWAVYHRISAVPLGTPLGQWRDFRFNDQLIWGLAVGTTIAFLPPFADGREAGVNLLVFFGTLYLLRGVGVLAWVARSRGVAMVLIVLTAIAPPLVAALALGVGVGDTWMDWRSRVPSNT